MMIQTKLIMTSDKKDDSLMKEESQTQSPCSSQGSNQINPLNPKSCRKRKRKGADGAHPMRKSQRLSEGSSNSKISILSNSTSTSKINSNCSIQIINQEDNKEVSVFISKEILKDNEQDAKLFKRLQAYLQPQPFRNLISLLSIYTEGIISLQE